MTKWATPVERDSWVEKYQAGVSVREIAQAADRSTETVHALLRRRGVNRGKPLKHARYPDREKWVEEYLAGASGQAIAEKYGCQPNAVYSLLERRGVKRRPVGVHAWKGGRTIREGYALINIEHSSNPIDQAMRNRLANGRYVLEHRLVMARHLGRPLTKEETVHHINGDKLDNRIENLQLRQGRHGKHQAHRCRTCGSTDIETIEL